MPTPLFVYGTLKSGFPNFHLNAGTRVPGEFRTALRFPLYIATADHIPWLVNQPGVGEHVKGELYEVDDAALAQMDVLERIGEPLWYARCDIEVQPVHPVQIEKTVGAAPAAPLRAQVYFGAAERIAQDVVHAGPLAVYTHAHASRYRDGDTPAATALHIRLLRPDELPALLALYAQLHPVDERLPEPAVVQSLWQELMAHPRYRYFGGYVREELVTTCNLTVVPNLTRGCKPYGLIENVVTQAAHRNRGHGKALLAHALMHAWAQGCYKVMLQTGRLEEPVLKFYESAGFDRHAKQAFVAKPPAP